jgi:hypothetical protein
MSRTVAGNSQKGSRRKRAYSQSDRSNRDLRHNYRSWCLGPISLAGRVAIRAAETLTPGPKLIASGRHE